MNLRELYKCLPSNEHIQLETWAYELILAFGVLCVKDSLQR